MRQSKKLFMTLAILLALSTTAFASGNSNNNNSNNTTNNVTNNNTTSNTTNAGGTGLGIGVGVGGDGGSAVANGGSAKVGDVAGGSVTGSGNSKNSNKNSATGGNATGGNATGGAVVGSGNSASNSSTNNSGNSSNNVSVSQNESKRPVNTAYAGPLTATEDTCMGSTSGGAQGMSFGLSVGSTWTDEECVRRKNATFMHNIGQREIAMIMMCENKSVYKAVMAAGTARQKELCGVVHNGGKETVKRQLKEGQNAPAQSGWTQRY